MYGQVGIFSSIFFYFSYTKNPTTVTVRVFLGITQLVLVLLRHLTALNYEERTVNLALLTYMPPVQSPSQNLIESSCSHPFSFVIVFAPLLNSDVSACVSSGTLWFSCGYHVARFEATIRRRNERRPDRAWRWDNLDGSCESHPHFLRLFSDTVAPPSGCAVIYADLRHV